jgi:hypothetical protein
MQCGGRCFRGCGREWELRLGRFRGWRSIPGHTTCPHANIRPALLLAIFAVRTAMKTPEKSPQRTDSGDCSDSYARAAAMRVRGLSAIFPGNDKVRLRFAAILERLETPRPLVDLAIQMMAIAIWLESRGEIEQASQAKLLAGFVQEEADAWPYP